MREIRLRNNAVVRVNVDGRWLYCSDNGLHSTANGCRKLDVSCDDLVRVACNNSIYTYEQMLCDGYFTLENGCRFGVAGAYSSCGKVFKEFTSICIRIPHCVKCANEDLLDLTCTGNTLIFGPPASGKTTLLRDVARRLSAVFNVVVLDERGELDVANFLEDCDVIKWLDKGSGVEMALRCMSPNYIVCDELCKADVHWLPRATSSGVNIVATLHASNLQSVDNFLGGNLMFNNLVACNCVGRYTIEQRS